VCHNGESILAEKQETIMSIHEQTDRLEQLVHRLDAAARLVRAWPLTGGVSAQVIAFELAKPDSTNQRWVLRLHGEADRRANPHIAADEFALLETLTAAGIPVPVPALLDVTGEFFGLPGLVMAFIDGAPEFNPTDRDDFVRQIAVHLARIHRVDLQRFDLTFLPDQAERMSKRLRNRPAQTDESLLEGRIRAVLEESWPLPPRNPTALLHGDFWPGNLLWRDAQIAAVIDWEDAALGDPLADVANARLEMLWAFGAAATEDFTRQYRALMPTLEYDHLPWWDLQAALRLIPGVEQWTDDAVQRSMMRERLRWFVERAFESLSSA
jgi:aminoglycoside phosphotransferase (APT) family kinase protein